MIELLPALMLFTLTMTITPGPNNMMIMTSGLNFGVRRSLPHFLGICTGFPVMVLLVGMGLGAVLKQYPMAFEAIRVGGLVYLLFLAFKMATTVPNLEQRHGTQSQPLTYWQAVLFQWLNPKAWVMATGALAAYTSATETLNWQVAVIALTFSAVAFPCVGLWLYFGSRLTHFLKQANHIRWFNRIMAMLLVLAVVWPMVDHWHGL
ncbi:Homoserine/homoserine lactone efflux protein [Saliniradius amylolyticus]|uniref:Homoserine/homoserine lactone efflux protein n=1 Tax=Saliniradius amylolyticus TaxID=2183582 RepID=A0A2S2E3P5_9ALTE|nr:LysE family translocator [Saliniradius amylolyticus]AWL11880.1 Homoserine/homoserine lactone efflux protein [Saliniradius amylolyticus]